MVKLARALAQLIADATTKYSVAILGFVSYFSLIPYIGDIGKSGR